MTRLLVSSLAALSVAVALAWHPGGQLGNGVLAGFLLGASLSALGVLWVRHQLLVRPRRALAAVAASFAVKFAALLAGTLALRFWEEAAARADWRSFAIAFAAAVVVVLPLGTAQAAAVLRERRAPGTADL